MVDATGAGDCLLLEKAQERRLRVREAGAGEGEGGDGIFGHGSAEIFKCLGRQRFYEDHARHAS